MIFGNFLKILAPNKFSFWKDLLYENIKLTLTKLHTHYLIFWPPCAFWTFLMNRTTMIFCENTERIGQLTSCSQYPKAIRSTPIFLQNYFTELDPNNFNLVISNSLLSWTQNHFPWVCLPVIYSGLFQTPAISNYLLFPHKVWNSGVHCMLSFFCNFVMIKPWRIAKFRLDYNKGVIDFVSNTDKVKWRLTQSQTLVKPKPKKLPNYFRHSFKNHSYYYYFCN